MTDNGLRAWRELALRLGAFLLLWFSWRAGLAGEVTNSFRPSAPVSPAQGANPLPSFQVKRGFRIELAAAEPMVAAPAALAFDERGRLFVAEMRDYPDRRDQSPHLGQIRMLEGLDENGVFQSSTVYAGDLPWPSAVACYGGGIFVAATPQILYLKDSAGNGTADVVRVVFSGFGARPYVPDPKALLNSFNWGLDNCLHCGTAGLGGRVSGLIAAQVPSVPLGNGDFAFDPRTLVIFPEAGPSQTGMSFDDRGRKFISDANQPLRLAMYEPRYLARNPFSVAPPELLDAASPATAVYRFPTQSQAPKTSARQTRPPGPAALHQLVGGGLDDGRPGLRGLSRKHLSVELRRERFCGGPAGPSHSPLCPAGAGTGSGGRARGRRAGD